MKRYTEADKETITTLEDNQIELEQKLLRKYCSVGKHLIEKAAEEQREINA
jgi:hypothetical protein